MGELADKEKDKALQLAISQIEKQFGKGAIIRLGDKPKAEGIQIIPTGALTLDLALGIGGIPYGRVTEIYGPEASGKTTLTLSIISECQKQGGTAAFIDAEHALDPIYAKAIGVDIDNLLVSQPDTGEQALEIVESLVRSGAVNLIVIDSVAALVPKNEIEGNMGDAVMGMQARLMSQALRKLTAIINRSNCSVVFINQIRMKIGVMYGNPETTTGGMALKFYSTVRIEIRKKDVLKRGLRQPCAREGSQEQARGAVQGRRVRDHLRAGHLQGELFSQRRDGPQYHPAQGYVVLPRRRQNRTGTRERGEGISRKSAVPRASR